MEELDALIARVVEIANEVLQEKRTPYDGAKELWRLSSAMWELPDALLPFVGLASEWEDHPTHRAEFDHDITLAMERLRRRFGN
jgi:hypothetical protein